MYGEVHTCMPLAEMVALMCMFVYQNNVGILLSLLSVRMR